MLTHGDFATYFSDDVDATLEGIEPQRFEGRGAVREWIEGAHAFRAIQPRSMFADDRYVGSEWEFVRNDGVKVPYAVIYELAEGQITALRLFFTGPIAWRPLAPSDVVALPRQRYNAFLALRHMAAAEWVAAYSSRTQNTMGPSSIVAARMVTPSYVSEASTVFSGGPS
jgi:hypothetical protein